MVNTNVVPSAQEPPSTLSPRQHYNTIFLVIYIWVSFMYIFGINYMDEARAYRQLNSEPSALFSKTADGRSQALLKRTPTWDGEIIAVPTYHEKYGELNASSLIEFSLVITVTGGIIGMLVYFEDRNIRKKPEDQRTRIALIISMVVVYYGVVILMRYGFYPDMTGILVTAAIYLALFFVIQGIQRFNPHFRVAQPDGSIDSAKYELLISLYQRYFIMFISILGFVAASLLVGASSMLQSMYALTGPNSSAIYHAVHMPYLQAFYSYAAFACAFLGFGVIREMHEKINDLMHMKPVKSAEWEIVSY